MSQPTTQNEEQDSMGKFASTYVWFIVGGVILVLLLLFLLHLWRLQKRGRMRMWGLRHCAGCHRKGPGSTNGWKGGGPGSVMCFKTKQYFCGRSDCKQAPDKREIV